MSQETGFSSPLEPFVIDLIVVDWRSGAAVDVAAIGSIGTADGLGSAAGLHNRDGEYKHKTIPC